MTRPARTNISSLCLYWGRKTSQKVGSTTFGTVRAVMGSAPGVSPPSRMILSNIQRMSSAMDSRAPFTTMAFLSVTHASAHWLSKLRSASTLGAANISNLDGSRPMMSCIRGSMTARLVAAQHLTTSALWLGQMMDTRAGLLHVMPQAHKAASPHTAYGTCSRAASSLPSSSARRGGASLSSLMMRGWGRTTRERADELLLNGVDGARPGGV